MTSKLAQMAFAHAQETACHPVHISTHWLNMTLILILVYKISQVKVEEPWLGQKQINHSLLVTHTVSCSLLTALREAATLVALLFFSKTPFLHIYPVTLRSLLSIAQDCLSARLQYWNSMCPQQVPSSHKLYSYTRAPPWKTPSSDKCWGHAKVSNSLTWRILIKTPFQHWALHPPENATGKLQESQGHWMKYPAPQIVRIHASFWDIASLAITDIEQSALAFFHWEWTYHY